MGIECNDDLKQVYCPFVVFSKITIPAMPHLEKTSIPFIRDLLEETSLTFKG